MPRFYLKCFNFLPNPPGTSCLKNIYQCMTRNQPAQASTYDAVKEPRRLLIKTLHHLSYQLPMSLS